jgi:hypothetical protein
MVSSTSAGLRADLVNVRGELAAEAPPTRATDRARCCRSILAARTETRGRISTEGIPLEWSDVNKLGKFAAPRPLDLTNAFSPLADWPHATHKRTESLAPFPSHNYSLWARFIVGRFGALLHLTFLYSVSQEHGSPCTVVGPYEGSGHRS